MEFRSFSIKINKKKIGSVTYKRNIPKEMWNRKIKNLSKKFETGKNTEHYTIL